MINPQNTAIVLFGNHFAIPFIEERGYEVYSHLGNTNIVSRRILNWSRKVGVKQIEKMFYNKKLIDKCHENYLVYDACASVGFLSWLHELHPASRIILFYDNPVSNSDVLIEKLDRLKCEVWSFDFDDSTKYGMKYNSEFYFEELKIQNKEPQYDVMFLGKDKGRYNKLLNIETQLEKKGISMYLHIVPDKKSETLKKERYKPGVSYNELRTIVSESNVLLDVLQEDQVGLTLRNMEAIFNNKKLITDNQKIKEYNFYSKENVFILGEDSWDTIQEFVRTPCIGYPKEVVEYYMFDNWIRRFDE